VTSLLGVGKGDGAEEDAIDDSQHRCDGAEAEGKREDDGEGVSGRVFEASQGVADVRADTGGNVEVSSGD
jgi:hypothetical protein